MAKDASKYPAINELYGDDSDYIINRGHRVADHLKELLGTQPSMEDVLEYIEEDVKKKRRGQVSQRRPEQGEAAGLPKTAGRADLNQGRGASFSVPQDWESRKLAARQQIRAMRDTWERELDPEDT
jgi:hypothetical protein